jgi:hypothetical protein
VKDHRPHAIATLFGQVVVRLPRFRCAGCGTTEAGVTWPPHAGSTPELDRLRAQLSALMTHRTAAEVLAQILPVDSGAAHETLRRHTFKVAERLSMPAAAEPATPSEAIVVTLDSTWPQPGTAVGEGRQHRHLGASDSIEAAADQGCEIRAGLRDRTEHLPASRRRFDIADPDLQVPLAGLATPDETIDADPGIPGLAVPRPPAQTLDLIDDHRFRSGALRTRILLDAEITDPPILDWFHVAMRLQHLTQVAGSLPSHYPRRHASLPRRA